MESSITFKFQGIEYSVSSKALEHKKVVLPDKRVLEIQGWFEFDDRPAHIYSLHEIPFLESEDLSPEDLAQKVWAPLAQQTLS